MKTARVYAFGDSLIAGTYDSFGGWFDRIKQDLHKTTAAAEDGTKYQAYNLGIGGETSLGLVRRFQAELAARHRSEWPAVIVIGIGKNDSRLDGGVPAVTIEEYERNLRTVVQQAQAVAVATILVGIGPCVDDEVVFKRFVYRRDALQRYDAVMSQVASETAVLKIDVYDKLLSAGGRVFYHDGLHLGDDGYKVIYDSVKPELMAVLGR